MRDFEAKRIKIKNMVNKPPTLFNSLLVYQKNHISWLIPKLLNVLYFCQFFSILTKSAILGRNFCYEMTLRGNFEEKRVKIKKVVNKQPTVCNSLCIYEKQKLFFDKKLVSLNFSCFCVFRHVQKFLLWQQQS